MPSLNNKRGLKMYKKLIKYFGSKNKMAKALKISRHSVQKWTFMPIKRAYEIEKISKGKFKIKDLIKINFQDYVQKKEGE